MKNYTYQNDLISKKQLRQLLAWSFTNYDSMQACLLADELKYLGFKYASQAGISISIEDLKIPFVKNLMLEKATQEIINSEKIYLKGKITEVERFQKIIDTWSLTSESLKEQVIFYFKNYDPLNSVYIMAFSGARGNLSQVRQLVGMRGLMSDPSGEIMNLPIKKNFREGLTITDYLMSGYGARKGIVDTALKTANSGYLTRRLIDVGQDILIREKDCLTSHSFLFQLDQSNSKLTYEKILGRVLAKPLYDFKTKELIIAGNTIITPTIISTIKLHNIQELYIRSPLTCKLYRAICQKCYGWDLANENLVDIGEAVGILAGQSIGEPGTQLTMRTFHTGGIFTSEARQQIISPVNGIIRFYKALKTVLLRTNGGEDVLITKNSGSIVLLPDDKTQKPIEIEVLRNTILFPKNNQYVSKDTVIGELVNTSKQIKTEIKPILSDYCGEIFIPRLKKKVNFINNNKLIWILSGTLYNGPKNSFINFSADFKLNRNSYIFRTKLINHYKASVEFNDTKKNLYQKLTRTTSSLHLWRKSSLKKLTSDVNYKNFLVTLEDNTYLTKVQSKNHKFYLQLTRTNQIGNLISNKFRTLTGGTAYYNYSNIKRLEKQKYKINYFTRNYISTKYDSLVSHKTLIWFGEETHRVNCELNLLLVEHGDFISKNFELIPGIFSKTSGIVVIRQKNDLVQTIAIKSGLLYQGKQFKPNAKKLYYPGEILASSISIKNLSFCDNITSNHVDHLLIRPVEIYEIPISQNLAYKLGDSLDSRYHDQVKSKKLYLYKPCQTIKGAKNLHIVSDILSFRNANFINKDSNLELVYNQKRQTINLNIRDKIRFNNYLLPSLRYNNIESCVLVQAKQFIDSYSILGYLESRSLNSLEIVKFKVKNKDIKQIFLISNKDCFTIPRSQVQGKTINDFIINSDHINNTGKIIIEGNKTFTLQKGRPYFFPNCTNQNLTNVTNIQYKIISANRAFPRVNTQRNIFLNYHNTATKFKSNQSVNSKILRTHNLQRETEFSKFFLKRNGKLFSSLIPKFLKTFSINDCQTDSNHKKLIQSVNFEKFKVSKFNRILLVQSSQLNSNKYKQSQLSETKLMLMKFLEYPFLKSTKSIGVYSITEDYFEQEVNSVFCKNSAFIEEGQTLGLLKLEKEITGDIVQGLPRIEEILETRKKNLVFSKLPTSQKKGLLIQKSSLDINFEFKKLGTTIKETDRINPHKLLKTYFNYYGIIKCFTCDNQKEVRYNRLVDNYEGSYKSFKKVQSFILNSVQSVYKSQGVTINDKHLEVIIKQMTTKVLITYEGNTPILRREVIDLYHIKYINDIVKAQQKQPACYIPLLLGITKAALNNPSFISAASFQETTRILTIAAIEGRIDWLRGLKENIIIGHLIPAGTGSQNYKNTFQKKVPHKSLLTKFFSNSQVL